MYRELLHQIKAVGEVHKAIRAAIFSLDRTWRDMHPFNKNVLDGVSLSAAYVDLSTNTLFLASTGCCRVIVGSRNSQGEVQVTADVGMAAAPSGNSPHGLSSGIATIQLTDTVDTIILGSQGLWYATIHVLLVHCECAVALHTPPCLLLLRAPGHTAWAYCRDWCLCVCSCINMLTLFCGLNLVHLSCRRDLTAQNALLRMQHYHASVPDASNGNGAAHLTNYALHNVTQRTRRMRDPRMRAIRHVSQLQSLWAGDIGNYKLGGRQPVRRRRGDVHGDMTSVVLHLDWAG